MRLASFSFSLRFFFFFCAGSSPKEVESPENCVER